jgi:multidrug efflux pump subunit AcrA (membrane-fusion protein)
MKSKHGVLDIPRESNQRQRRIRMTIYSVAGVAAIAGITIFLSRLKPAAPIVDKTAVWVDTVKKGPMVIAVRGPGTVAAQTKGAKAPSNSTTVLLRIPEAQAKDVRPGEAATIDTHNGVVPGHVVGIAPIVLGGVVTAEVKLDGPAPNGTSPGQEVDGTIELAKLENITYVGRPVFGQPNTTVSLFKLDPDGKGASLVQVQLGRASVNSIEVLSGLQPADKAILSDMSAWDSFNRIRLE